MILLSLSGFLGRFHPVVVHLPIGILLLGVLLHWLSRKTVFRNLQPSVGIILLLGAFFAVLSCISGWMLGEEGDYDTAILDRHRWLGISVAVISIIYYLNYTRKLGQKLPAFLPYVLSLILLLLTAAAGHWGGTLTHGEGYLTQGVMKEETGGEIKKVIPDIQEAVAYDDIIQPVLQSKCYNCHGSSKQKGKLRLDTRAFIEKGGEDGEVLVPGKSEESEMYKRIMLDLLEKKHMPPKGKPQLSEAETNLVQWWINTGASFDQKVKDLPRDTRVMPVLMALQQPAGGAHTKPDVPAEPVNAALPEAVNQLKKLGITVIPVASGSNYLSVNFVSAANTGDSVVKLLEPLASQLVWLKLGDTKITDTAMISVAKLVSLTRLSLSNTAVTDKGIAMLQPLSRLQYLNIAGTGITAAGLTALKGLPDLQSIYIYQSKVARADTGLMRQAFPGVAIDTGGYVLPLLEGDTTLVTKVK